MKLQTGHSYDLICTICEKKFKDKYVLKSHIARIHSDDMQFKCTKCEHRFKDEGSCRRHQANKTLHSRLEKEKISPRLSVTSAAKSLLGRDGGSWTSTTSPTWTPGTSPALPVERTFPGKPGLPSTCPSVNMCSHFLLLTSV